MADFSTIEGEITPHVPQADVILIGDAIRRAVQTFCEKTLVLEAVTDPRINVIAGEPIYTLPAVVNRTIVRAKRGEVWYYNGPDDTKPRQLDPTNPNDLDNRHTPYHGRFRGPLNYPFFKPDENWRTSIGTPSLFYQPMPHQVRIVPIPRLDVEWSLKVTYHLKPSNTATEVDDLVLENWRAIIVSGALADLLQVKHKPWTDVQLGSAYGKDFDSKTNEIVKEREKSFESQDSTVGRVRAYT
jgi:hypothetical protein